MSIFYGITAADAGDCQRRTGGCSLRWQWQKERRNSVTVSDMKEAWKLAERLFPTAYEKDMEKSLEAGHPVYCSAEDDVDAWIADLGDRLELNYADGSSEIIRTGMQDGENDQAEMGCKVFLTDSDEAAYLIAQGLAEEYDADTVIETGSGSVDYGSMNDLIPDIYKKRGKHYAAIIYEVKNGKPEYNLIIC